MTREVTKENVIRDRIRTESPRLKDGSGLVEIRTESVISDFLIIYAMLLDLDLTGVCCVVVNPVEEPVGSHEILISNVSNPPTSRFQPVVGTVKE